MLYWLEDSVASSTLKKKSSLYLDFHTLLSTNTTEKVYPCCSLKRTGIPFSSSDNEALPTLTVQ